MRRVAMIAACFFVLAACSVVTHVRPGERAVINGSLAVQPTQSWSRLVSFSLADSNLDVWTMDGHLIDRLCFVAGLEDKASIHKTPPGGTPEPVFRSNMSALEVMEFFEAVMSRGGPGMFKATGLRPARFAGVDGFRFDFTFVTQDDEVERRGFAVGAIHKGRLFLVYYHGARIHYFGKNLPEVEAIIKSAVLL